MAVKKMKCKLHVYEGSLECEEAIQNLLSVETIQALPLLLFPITVEDYKKEYDFELEIETIAHDEDVEIDAVIMPLVLPTLELEDGRRYEGIRQIKRFLEDCI